MFSIIFILLKCITNPLQFTVNSCWRPQLPQRGARCDERLVIYYVSATFWSSQAPRKYDFFLPKSCPSCPAHLLATRGSSLSLWGGISRRSWWLLVSPLVSQGLPRASKKSPKNHPKSLLKLGVPLGGPRHAPRRPHRP